MVNKLKQRWTNIINFLSRYPVEICYKQNTIRLSNIIILQNINYGYFNNGC